MPSSAPEVWTSSSRCVSMPSATIALWADMLFSIIYINRRNMEGMSTSLITVFNNTTKCWLCIHWHRSAQRSLTTWSRACDLGASRNSYDGWVNQQTCISLKTWPSTHLIPLPDTYTPDCTCPRHCALIIDSISTAYSPLPYDFATGRNYFNYSFSIL